MLKAFPIHWFPLTHLLCLSPKTKERVFTNVIFKFTLCGMLAGLDRFILLTTGLFLRRHSSQIAEEKISKLSRLLTTMICACGKPSLMPLKQRHKQTAAYIPK